MITETDKKIINSAIELENSIKPERAQQERDRFETVTKLYADFIAENSNIKDSVYLNKVLLAVVVVSHFDDIYRYKLYSHSPRADSHKQGAYIIKWISKIRPIQILPNIEVTKELLFINAEFAIFVGFSFLKLNIFDTIAPHFYKHLIYETQYREVSGKSSATLLYENEKMASIQVHTTRTGNRILAG
jgi:hypothetical protein